MGEFGAVNVLTLNSPDTNTIPLQIENLYNGFQIPGAFALSTVLAFLGLVTLIAKTLLEWKIRRDVAAAQSETAS
jgi:sulfate transport system permease protein